jgi:hypothetical protein
MTDGKIAYILYGIENQAEIHYAMAVKNNLYDALEYAVLQYFISIIQTHPNCY